jgi:hypothetical protein
MCFEMGRPLRRGGGGGRKVSPPLIALSFSLGRKCISFDETINSSVMLEWILERWGWLVWRALVNTVMNLNIKIDFRVGWDSIDWVHVGQHRGQWQALCTRWWTFRFRKILGSSWVAERLAASQDGPASMEFVLVHLNVNVCATCFVTAVNAFILWYRVVCCISPLIPSAVNRTPLSTTSII